jgi:uroporphyrinogen decarboxylase
VTSRERVYASLDGELKGRVPRQLWVLPWASTNHAAALERIRRDFPDDIASPGVPLPKAPSTVGDAYRLGEFVDEWGCIFENIQPGVIGEVKRPRIASWDDVEGLRTPDELLTLDVDAIDAACEASDRFIMMGGCARPFERLQFLRTTELLYLDLGELAAGVPNPGLRKLMTKVHEFHCNELEAWSKTKVDALMFMDDWGSQQSLLIRPDTWRELFRPMYRDYIEIAHRAGKRIFMHSDGYIADIIPDLIELGLDAVNSQLFCMGLDRLERFRGEICFWGEIDRQHLLPKATTAEIAEAVEEVHDHLFADGGVIAQCEFGPGAKPENVYEVFAAWDRLAK